MEQQLQLQQPRPRLRGEGSIYRHPRSQFLWVKYSFAGKAFRESSRTADPAKAARFLRQRLAQIERGESFGPKVDKVRIADLAEGLLRDYRINGHKSLADVEARWRLHLQPFFGQIKAIHLGSALLAQYIDQRQQDGASNASINREMACLRRMYRLGYLASPPRVIRIPHIPQLREDNVRQGFINAEQYSNLVAHCPELWLRALLETACNYGWRVSELLALRVRQVDLSDRTIRLEPGTTKNREGREVTIESAMLLELLRQCLNGKDQDDYVFTRGKKPVRDFRKSWENLCTAAGVPDLLFHDLRRTAARNLRAAGIPEEIIMRIAGWKTPGVFRRYAIVNRDDVRKALQKADHARREQS
jgi:integrase